CPQRDKPAGAQRRCGGGISVPLWPQQFHAPPGRRAKGELFALGRRRSGSGLRSRFAGGLLACGAARLSSCARDRVMIGSRYEKTKVLTFDERVDPTSTALVIIDVQNDFALPQGVCGQVGDDISPVAPMVARLKTLIDTARKAGVLIVFVRTIYDEAVLSPSLAEQYLRRGYPNSICLSDTVGAQFYGGIGPQQAPNEVLITKHRYSAFWGSPIDLVLRRNGIRTVVLTGIATEVCVESTARDAFFRDYQVVVPEDCVGCYSQERQQAALVVIARSFGVVTVSSDIAAVWQRRGNGPRNWQPEARAQRALTTLATQVQPAHTALLLVNLQSNLFGETDARGNVALRRGL